MVISLAFFNDVIILHLKHDFSKCHVYLLLYEIMRKNFLKEVSLLLKKCGSACFYSFLPLFREKPPSLSLFTLQGKVKCLEKESLWGVYHRSAAPSVLTQPLKVSKTSRAHSSWEVLQFRGCMCAAFCIHSSIQQLLTEFLLYVKLLF